MQKRILLLILNILIWLLFAHAQKESANWYFGFNAGLNFDTNLAIPLLDGQLVTNEGCATISNKKGELLFYTDGGKVWDKNHRIMPNGEGLLGNFSSTQSAIIVPKPGSTSIFYVFTVTDAAGIDGLRYSEVDLDLNNNNGDVSSKKNILLTTPTTEKISAVQHANGKDFWVVSHAWDSSSFLAYLITETGVSSTPIVSTTGSFHGNYTKESAGYLKISPNGKKLALARWHINSIVEIFDFDSRTGNVSNPIALENIFDNSENSGAYGLEFSPSSKLLYVTDLNLNNFSSKLHQFDLSSNNKATIIDSDFILYSGRNFLSGIQLALDGKIYISNALSSFIDVIENPNTKGMDCNYVNKAIGLKGRRAVYGLPPFIQSYFVATIEAADTCQDKTTTFTINTEEPVDGILWDFGDGNISSGINVEHEYDMPGEYTINATLTSGFSTYNLSSTIKVFEKPIIDIDEHWALCSDAPITLFLNSVHDAYSWSTGETSSEINIDKPGVYSVTVYNNHPNSLISCEASASIEVLNSGIPYSVSIDVSDWTVDNNSITIDVKGKGLYEYALNNFNYQDSNVFNNLPAGEYTIYINDKNGCGYIEQDAYILNYPKYFTPNGDGYNDFWKIDFSEYEPDITIRIFDRYGKFLKQLNPFSNGWDGTYNGNRLSSSDYWFVVNRPSKGKQHKGHFALKR